MSTVTDLESYQQFALQQQAQNNAWSAQQAQKQMDFQREMSNSAHQREVADLQAAGLNPILSANSGASVPNGAQAEGDRSAAGNVGAILQQVLQAQSAREVAAMYNAATINAASIAANASMYGADTQYKIKQDFPSGLEGLAAKLIQQFLPEQGDPSNAKNVQSNTQTAVQSFVNAIKNLSGSFSTVQVNGRSYPSVQNYFKQQGWNWNRLSSNQQRFLTLAYTGFLKGNRNLFLKLLNQYGFSSNVHGRSGTGMYN